MATSKKPNPPRTRKKTDAEDLPADAVTGKSSTAAKSPTSASPAKAKAADTKAAKKPAEPKATASAAPAPGADKPAVAAKSASASNAAKTADDGKTAPTKPEPKSGWYITAGLALPILGGIVLAAVQQQYSDAISSTQTETRSAVSLLNERVDIVENAILDLPATTGLTAEDLEAATQPLTERLYAMDQKIDNLKIPAPIVTNAAPEVDLTPLTGQLAAQSTSITKLQETVGDLQSRLEAVQAENTELKQALAGNLSGLGDRLAAVESSRAPQLTGQALALGALATAVRGSLPYQGELATLATLGADVPADGPLAAHAASGIPTLAVLRKTLPDAIRAAQFAAAVPADATAKDRALGALTTMFAPRPAGPVEGDTVEAIISRGEAALDAGDVEQSVAIFATLQGPAADAMASWLTRARARTDTLAALAALEKSVRQVLSPTSGN